MAERFLTKEAKETTNKHLKDYLRSLLPSTFQGSIYPISINFVD